MIAKEFKSVLRACGWKGRLTGTCTEFRPSNGTGMPNLIGTFVGSRLLISVPRRGRNRGSFMNLSPGRYNYYRVLFPKTIGEKGSWMI
jgi:hypothetical protein